MQRGRAWKSRGMGRMYPLSLFPVHPFTQLLAPSKALSVGRGHISVPCEPQTQADFTLLNAHGCLECLSP